jgi:predicted 3-demethylubiquinone-9 3-methyltransferase (glyoxalase superfamily)
MDSARGHDFSFNEAVSFIVSCESQEEIDYYWGRLSADPAAEQCGWLKDKFTVSWQIVPTAMDRMLLSGDEAAVARVTQAFLKMKKFDVAALERAFAGGR